MRLKLLQTNDNTVTTATGNLILNSAEGTVEIKDQLRVTGITTFESTQGNIIGNVNTGAVQFDGGVGIAENLSVGGNLDVNGDTTLDKLTVDLNIIANGNIVGDDATNISGINQVTASTFSGALTGDVTGDLTGTASKIKITNTTTAGTYYLTFASNHTNGNYDLRANDRYYVTPGNTAAGSELRVRGDIIAFAAAASDDKLKTNKISITDPLAIK